MKERLGAEYPAFKEALEAEPVVSVRMNVAKSLVAGGEQRVESSVQSQVAGFTGTSIPWCSTGLYLPERPVYTLDPTFHAGAYYVQEASSMFLEQAVRASVDLSQSLRVLDLCAAPGGKSTHLLTLINHKSILVSNEVIRTRASILSENVQKWGTPNVIVTNNDPKDFTTLNGYFDLIVVDAPCSGEGLFRKDEAAIDEWSEDNANLCSLRQRRILSDMWPALKENGALIYCTCTYNEAENEDNLVWLSQQKDVEFIEMKSFDGVQKVEKEKAIGYRFMPHKVNGEGFFISAIRKVSKESTVRLSRDILKEARNNPSWLHHDYKYYQLNDLLITVPIEEMMSIPNLDIVTRGVAVATVKGNKFIPEHALALSHVAKGDAFPLMNVDRHEALQYLSKDTLTPKTDEKGFALVTYEGLHLGFVNRLGNRINNLYPANWRIRMSIKGT